MRYREEREEVGGRGRRRQTGGGDEGWMRERRGELHIGRKKEAAVFFGLSTHQFRFENSLLEVTELYLDCFVTPATSLDDLRINENQVNLYIDLRKWT